MKNYTTVYVGGQSAQVMADSDMDFMVNPCEIQY